MPQLTPQEDADPSRKILGGKKGRTDRRPGYRVQHRDDGRTGAIVAVGGDPLSATTNYTVRWDDGQIETQVSPDVLDDVFG
jgi:hypothetical protein